MVSLWSEPYLAVTVHSHSHKRSGQTARTTIPECSSSYLPSDMDTDTGDGQQSLVHSHSRSDNMSDVGPRCIKGGEAQTLSRWGISLTVHKLLIENQLLQKLYYWLTYLMIQCLCSGCQVWQAKEVAGTVWKMLDLNIGFTPGIHHDHSGQRVHICIITKMHLNMQHTAE